MTIREACRVLIAFWLGFSLAMGIATGDWSWLLFALGGLAGGYALGLRARVKAGR